VKLSHLYGEGYLYTDNFEGRIEESEYRGSNWWGREKKCVDFSEVMKMEDLVDG